MEALNIAIGFATFLPTSPVPVLRVPGSKIAY